MHKKYSLFIVLLLLLGVYLAPSSQAQSTALFTPAFGANHASWAQVLLNNVPAANTYYQSSGMTFSWAGYNGATAYYSIGNCAPFITALLKHSYDITSTEMRTWTGSTSPNSEGYYSLIVNQRGFIRITNISQIQAGDIIAMDYLDTTAVSGHTMMAAGTAAPRSSTSPVISNTYQWTLSVIDQSSSYHGSTDTRALSGKYSGLGQGVVRLYTDVNGTILGYTWSTSSGSIYYNSSTRPLAVGRLNLSYTLP